MEMDDVSAHRCIHLRLGYGGQVGVSLICPALSLDAARCRSIPLDPARCRSMPLDPARCRSMPLDAARSRSIPLDGWS
jgi:hypothetical protein